MHTPRPPRQGLRPHTPGQTMTRPILLDFFKSIAHATALPCALACAAIATPPAPCATAQTPANAGIWATPDPTPGHATAPESGDTAAALKTWIALQNGLYDVVVRFDEQAAAMQKHLPAFEQYVLERTNEAIRAGENVAKISYQVAKMPPKTQLQYNAVAAEPTVCAQLDTALNAYIAHVTPALEATIDTLVRTTANASDDEKRSISKRLATATAAMANRKRAQEILYLCIYKLKSETGKPRNYSVERTMRIWYRIQLPILDAWLGNVD